MYTHIHRYMYTYVSRRAWATLVSLSSWQTPVLPCCSGQEWKLVAKF